MVKRRRDSAGSPRRPGNLPLPFALCVCLLVCCAAALAAGLGEPKWVAGLHDAAGRRIALRWSPVPGATSYRLWRRAAAGAPFEPRAALAGIQFFDEPAPPGTWTYRVQALAAGQEGPFSEELTVAVPAPPAPKSAQAAVWHRTVVRLHERGDGPPRFTVELTWRPVDGALGYRILRREAGAGEFVSLGFVNALGAVDDTVEEGRTYEYALVTLGEGLDDSAPSVTRVVAVAADKAAARFAARAAATFTAVRAWEVLNALPGSAVHRRVPLDDPFDVAYDAARDLLYVSSTTNRHVQVLRGADGGHVATLGPKLGAAEFKRPLGIGLDAAGNLLVADEAQAAILVVSPAGRLLRRIPLAGKGLARPPRPLDVAAHRDGRLFVSDGANNQVVVFSARGDQLARWGAPKKGEALLGIGAIEVSAAGEVLVADAAAGRIRSFTAAGRPVAAFAERGQGAGKVLFLGGFTALPEGGILVSDIWNATITAFGPAAGPLVLAPGSSPAAPPAAPLLGPLNLASDGGRRLFVVEAIANRVTCLELRRVEEPAAEDTP